MRLNIKKPDTFHLPYYLGVTVNLGAKPVSLSVVLGESTNKH